MVIVYFFAMRFHERRGHWPLMKAQKSPVISSSDLSSQEDVDVAGKSAEIAPVTANIREICE
jgi:hypothetical protein